MYNKGIFKLVNILYFSMAALSSSFHKTLKLCLTWDIF